MDFVSAYRIICSLNDAIFQGAGERQESANAVIHTKLWYIRQQSIDLHQYYVHAILLNTIIY